MKKKIISLFLAVMLVLPMCFSAFAGAPAAGGGGQVTEVTAKQAQDMLVSTIARGYYAYQGGGNTGQAQRVIDYTKKRYETKDGGYMAWVDVVSSNTDNPTYINQNKYDQLTSASKRTVLEGMFEIANAMEDDCSNRTTDYGITTDNVESMMTVLQNNSGQGSQMLAMLMKNTKPNYIAANKIYEPFSGPVGTALALIAILIMAALGLTMALDLAYIVIPAFQMLCGGGSDAGQAGPGAGGKKAGLGGLISSEAKHAVKTAEGGQGGQAGGGEYKAAVGTYLKHRWIGLSILGICLLYLVQGQIYNFVAWFVDLFSGFLNF